MRNTLITLLLSLLSIFSMSQPRQGFDVKIEKQDKLIIEYNFSEYILSDVNVSGEIMKSVHIPNVFLSGNEGAPDLPSDGKYVAIPQGSSVDIQILNSDIEVIEGINIAPTPETPLDSYDGDLVYKKDMSIYSKNEFYPQSPVIISELTKIRGVDVVLLSISPFQYNPVSKELIINRNIEVEINFTNGNGKIGEDRLRNRWFDAMLYDYVLNKNIIPEIDYNVKHNERSIGFEYLIIVPDSPDFISWADTIKKFRTEEGILTGVVTTTELGGNNITAIKNYITNAYNSWDIPPVAVLMLGDINTTSTSLPAYYYSHPSGYPNFPSDNYYADVDGDNLPDIVFARMVANNNTELKTMITKFINYETNPPTKESFYNKPITAMGWQTERWFQLCSEIVSGYFKQKGKTPTRINDVYSGNPLSDPWSTAYNTNTILNYFGVNGLGYIPATPQQLGGFVGGSSTDITNAINDGSFMILHRDHGNYSGWGEPSYNTNNIPNLTNINNELPYVFSINCQTGAYHRYTDSFGEKFYRHTYNGQNSGALGVLAPSEVSYSFINDTYLWGVFDNLFPDFMPDKSTTFPTSKVLPAFAMTAGKYFLYQSNWATSSTAKLATYRLYHHHGDAFMNLYTEVPQHLNVSHTTILNPSDTHVEVVSDAGSFIALTSNNTILATAVGSGQPINIPISIQPNTSKISITITKQNYFRYSSSIDVNTNSNSNIPISDFVANHTNIYACDFVSFTSTSINNPTSWNWIFEGGNPQTSTEENPVVEYENPGIYSVSLTVANEYGSNTKTKTSYITVVDGTPVANFSVDNLSPLAGEYALFTNTSTNNPTSWNWVFEGGNPETSTEQNPVVVYNTPGVYDVTLTVSNNYGDDVLIKNDYITVNENIITYCESKANSSVREWIGKFTFGNYIKTSAGDGYSDYTNDPIIISSGQVYNITVTPNFQKNSRREFIKIWIDFNNDGDFIDVGEEVFSYPAATSIVSGNILIPNTFIGSTRLRLSMKNNGYATPCEIFSNGEVEDYTITVDTDLLQQNLNDVSKIRIYPNPTSDNIYILINDDDFVEVSLYNMNGTLLKQKNVNGFGNMNIEDLDNGVYIFKIISENSTIFEKIIKF